jgi:hypothetical protein
MQGMAVMWWFFRVEGGRPSLLDFLSRAFGLFEDIF